ncbi:MAG TPA: SRPBCC family protein, partial [Nitrospiria bacterium]|nr:SRPBCC family protein [Nitrospiria bacterium]
MEKVAYQGMSEIEVKARPEQIWAILEDSTQLSAWAPMIKQTTGKIERIGSVRTCQVEWERRKDEVVERCIEATPNKKIAWEME